MHCAVTRWNSRYQVGLRLQYLKPALIKYAADWNCSSDWEHSDFKVDENGQEIAPAVEYDSFGDPIAKSLYLPDLDQLKQLFSGIELYNHVFKIEFVDATIKTRVMAAIEEKMPAVMVITHKCRIQIDGTKRQN